MKSQDGDKDRAKRHRGDQERRHRDDRRGALRWDPRAKDRRRVKDRRKKGA